MQQAALDSQQVYGGVMGFIGWRSIQVLNCAIADIEQAAVIFCEAYTVPPYNETWELANAQAYLQSFFEIDPANCFIAEENGEV